MPNPFNPLDWLKSAQDWFSKTERSSGFRPFLIFFLMLFGFVIVLLTWFPDSEVTTKFAVNSLYISVVGFVVLYFFKAAKDPDFCRSEKHIETVKRIEMMEQKGDPGPTPIDVTTTPAIPNPESRKISDGPSGGAQ